MTYKVNKSISAKENLYALIQYTWPDHVDILNEDNVSVSVEPSSTPGVLSVTLSPSESTIEVIGVKTVTYNVVDLTLIDTSDFISDPENLLGGVDAYIETLPCVPSEIAVSAIDEDEENGWSIGLSAIDNALTVKGSVTLDLNVGGGGGPGFGEHLVLHTQGTIDLSAPIGSIQYSIDEKETWLQNTAADFTVSLPSEVETTVYIKSNDDVELTGPLEVRTTDINTSNFRGVNQWWESSRPIRLNVKDNQFYVPNSAPPNITDMTLMFSNASAFNGDISQWDVSSVTDMLGMFYGVISFNGDLSSWDVSNVTDMSRMFYGARVFNSDISQWDVSSVTNMYYMFTNANVFNSDISRWDVSNVSNMSSMFRGAISFNQDLSNWNVSNVTNMVRMFQGASSFNQDLSSWCVSGITSKPFDFDNNTTAWTLTQPIWGTCPPR